RRSRVQRADDVERGEGAESTCANSGRLRDGPQMAATLGRNARLLVSVCAAARHCRSEATPIAYRRAMKKSVKVPEPDSPIPFRAGSNGEFVPRAPTTADRRAEELFRRVVDARARKLGVSRRAFVESACGTAAALWVINVVYGCGGD